MSIAYQTHTAKFDGMYDGSDDTSDNAMTQILGKFGRSSDENEYSAKHIKATHHTKEQREEVTRVRKCSKKDYYAILDLKEDCSEYDIEKAYEKLSQLTNPHNNRFNDAKKAFECKLINSFEYVN
jgi:hypothetical protein